MSECSYQRFRVLPGSVEEQYASPLPGVQEFEVSPFATSGLPESYIADARRPTMPNAVTIAICDSDQRPSDSGSRHIAAVMAAATNRLVCLTGVPGVGGRRLGVTDRKQLRDGDFTSVCEKMWSAALSSLDAYGFTTDDLQALRIGYSGFGAAMALRMIEHVPPGVSVADVDLWNVPDFAHPDPYARGASRPTLASRCAESAALAWRSGRIDIPIPYLKGFRYGSSPDVIIRAALERQALRPDGRATIIYDTDAETVGIADRISPAHERLAEVFGKYMLTRRVLIGSGLSSRHYTESSMYAGTLRTIDTLPDVGVDFTAGKDF